MYNSDGGSQGLPGESISGNDLKGKYNDLACFIISKVKEWLQSYKTSKQGEAKEVMGVGKVVVTTFTWIFR